MAATKHAGKVWFLLMLTSKAEPSKSDSFGSEFYIMKPNSMHSNQIYMKIPVVWKKKRIKQNCFTAKAYALN